MLKIERKTIIEKELEKKGSLSISMLSKLLDCSEETIRRDLKELESARKLTRTRGGAFLMDKFDKSYSSQLRKILCPEEKLSIAKQALQYVKDNDVIMLDSSTTCLTFAELIINNNLSVTIVTNSMLICNLFNNHRTNINLICLGGTFRWSTSSFMGYHTTDALSSYYADSAFISCPKSTLEEGLSDNHLNEARVREGMLKHSQQRILLLDHTKFGSSANIRFEGLNNVNVIITDCPLPAEWEDFCKSKGITVHCGS